LTDKKLAIIIPAYNEEANIGRVLDDIPRQIEGVNHTQVFVIDDGSKDATASVARQHGATVISHKSNQGVGRSFKTGLEAALESGADVMVNIDGDGQFLPQEIPLLIQPILDDLADFVPADRFTNPDGSEKRPEHMSPLKFWGNQMMSNLISTLSGRRFRDVSCGFRAYSREAMLRLNLSGKFTYTQETFLDLSFKDARIQPLPVTIRYFKDRKSRVASNLFQYTFRTLNIIIRVYRDFYPLRFFFNLGLVPFSIGLLEMIWMGIFFLQTGNFTPYKAVGLTGIYLFTLGLLLFITGFLADMLTRINQNQEKMLYWQKRQYYEGKQKQDEE
jgi:glycosyltransferase involved in cell wall biosynthesis